MGVNHSRPGCMPDACLHQVVGYTDQNPLAQYEGCVAYFGAPHVTVEPASTETVLSTVTATVSHTYVGLDTVTVHQTILESVTSYTDIFDETTTDFTDTVTSTTDTTTTTTLPPRTITTTTSASSPPVVAKRAVKQSRRGCKPRTSEPSTSSTSSTTFTSSTSSTPTTSTSTPPFPIASNCPSREQYYSACSCIYAVSSVSTATPPARTSISTVTETVSVPVTSTSTRVENVNATSTTVDLDTHTLTSTIDEITSTTTTSTSTSYMPASTPTEGLLQMNINGTNTGPYIQISVSPYGAPTYFITNASSAADATVFHLPTGGGQVSVPSMPSILMYGYGIVPSFPDYGQVEFTNAAYNDDDLYDVVVTCVSDIDGYLACTAPWTDDTDGPVGFAWCVNPAINYIVVMEADYNPQTSCVPIEMHFAL